MSDSTDTITIRVPKLLKEQLEKNSKKNQQNLNMMINQILVKKMHWDEQLSKLGWLTFDPSTIKAIISYLTEKEITEVSKISQQKIIKGIQFIYGDVNIQNIVDFIDSWLATTNTPFRHTEDSESHKFLVFHDLGKNWSIFANQVAEGFVTDSGYEIKDLIEKEDSYSFTLVK